MGHDHYHHTPAPRNVNRAFITGIILNAAFVAAEIVAGIRSNSLALLADAGHNFTDVVSLLLALLAFRLMKVKATRRYTYGYQKTTILVALFNALILLFAIANIGKEAVQRLFKPEILEGYAIPVVATIGVAINAITAFLFYKDKEKDLNIKSAYLHLAADAAVSLGVVIGGVIIILTRWYWVDSIISFIIMIVIFVSTYKLLRDVVPLSIDAVPKHIDLEEVISSARKIPGIIDIHHIHVWGMSTTQNALTAHLVVEDNVSLAESERIKHDLRHALEHLNIHHVTLEVETSNDCRNEIC